MRRLVWFSCGAASAMLAKLAVEAYGDECTVVYCDTSSSEHPDNVRMIADVEKWVGRPFTRIKSGSYTSIDDVFARRRYMSGPRGAICTVELKKRPREEFQRIDDVHLFGFTVDEQKRADDFEKHNPELRTEWLLIDRGVTKDDCHHAMAAAGIAPAAMYELDFEHNNCPGCVKATSPRYWNAIRRHFPDVFARRAIQSRAIGARLVRVKNVRIFLDELEPDEGGPVEQIDCGPACQMPLGLDDAA